MGVSEVQQKEKMKRAMINKAIREKGYKFINLIMIKRIANRIHGAHVLFPYSTVDGATNEKTFDFKIGGGRLAFNIDEAIGEMTCKMLDCEHNRKFLASQMGAGYWEIEDEKVREELKELARVIKRRAVAYVGGFTQNGSKDLFVTTSAKEDVAIEGSQAPDTQEAPGSPEAVKAPDTQEAPEEKKELKTTKPTKGKKITKKSFATFEE